MKLPNLTNAFGTVTAILTALSAALMAIGCTPGATDFAAKCAVSWLPPTWMPIMAGVFGLITFVLKMMRPGGALHSLFGSTAVVVADGKGAPGVVTKAQVASK